MCEDNKWEGALTYILEFGRKAGEKGYVREKGCYATVEDEYRNIIKVTVSNCEEWSK